MHFFLPLSLYFFQQFRGGAPNQAVVRTVTYESHHSYNVTLVSFTTSMKRAELGLLEVLGLLVRMPGEGDVTALPCFVGS
jgi:hypothetical protein